MEIDLRFSTETTKMPPMFQGAGFSRLEHEARLSCGHRNLFPVIAPRPGDTVWCSSCRSYAKATEVTVDERSYIPPPPRVKPLPVPRHKRPRCTATRPSDGQPCQGKAFIHFPHCKDHETPDEHYTRTGKRRSANSSTLE